MRRSNRAATGIPRFLAPVLLTAVLGACSDHPPTAPMRDPGALPPARTLQEFTCTGTTSGTLNCAPARVAGGRGIIYGSQHVNVRLTSSNLSYDSISGIYQFDVTVQNLLNEAIGTPDGSVADPEGIRVFFHSGPTVTSGSGTAEVYNPDGYDTFTTTNQPYFAYNEILEKNEVSAAKTWQLLLSPGVQTFSFSLLIETDVQYLLVINEVLANPGGTILDANGEWFEIHNAGTFAVNLQNLVIADSAASGRRPYHLITASVSVPSGGYVVLGNTTNTTNNGGVTVDYAYGAALALANSVDAIKISRVYGTDTLTLDRAAYASAAISAKNGISRELINPSLDNANIDGSNWADAGTTAVYGSGGRGTPRAQNSAFVP